MVPHPKARKKGNVLYSAAEKADPEPILAGYEAWARELLVKHGLPLPSAKPRRIDARNLTDAVLRAYCVLMETDVIRKNIALRDSPPAVAAALRLMRLFEGLRFHEWEPDIDLGRLMRMLGRMGGLRAALRGGRAAMRKLCREEYERVGRENPRMKRNSMAVLVSRKLKKLSISVSPRTVLRCTRDI